MPSELGIDKSFSFEEEEGESHRMYSYCVDVCAYIGHIFLAMGIYLNLNMKQNS